MCQLHDRLVGKMHSISVNLWFLSSVSHHDGGQLCLRCMWEVNVAIDCEKVGCASVECINWVRFYTLLNIFLIIKPNSCTNFSNLFLEWNCTCFGQFLCPSSGVFYCTHSSGICRTGLLCVQWKTPDDGQRNCLKHVEFHSKDKFERLVHLVGFMIRNLTQCMVTLTSNF